MVEDGPHYIDVYDAVGSYCSVRLEDAGLLDASVSAYIDSGRTRDSIIHLTTVGGAQYCILASTVRSWIESSPESRRLVRERDAALKTEDPIA